MCKIIKLNNIGITEINKLDDFNCPFNCPDYFSSFFFSVCVIETGNLIFC